jgi:hypothetical protein
MRLVQMKVPGRGAAQQPAARLSGGGRPVAALTSQPAHCGKHGRKGSRWQLQGPEAAGTGAKMLLLRCAWRQDGQGRPAGKPPQCSIRRPG